LPGSVFAGARLSIPLINKLQSKASMNNRTRTDILLLAGFCAFLFFYGLSAFGLIGADEPRYAQVAREMLARQDWITPVLGGKPWLEKPPLYYWQAMLAYSVFGVSDFAARIPSALDATFAVIAVYLFFRKFRRGVEVDAALITAAGAAMIGYARAASTDMGLAASFTAGMLAWWAWRESGRRILLAAFYAAMALGMLAKGPVAPLLAGGILVWFALAVRDFRALIRTLWLPGILLFSAIALPWYAAVELRNPEFFRDFILQHNLARFSSNLYHHPEPFWYYIPVTLLAFVPWMVFVVAALVESLRVWLGQRGSREERDLALEFRIFAICWLVVPVLFFSLSASKLPGYILPAIPAGTVLLADYLLRQLEHALQPPLWIVILHAGVACAPIVPGILIGFLVNERRLPGGRPLLSALAVAGLLAVAMALTLLRGRLGLRMLRFVTLIPVVLTVAAVLKLGAAALDAKLSTRPLAIELNSLETHRLPLAVCGASREVEYGLAFYRDQVIARYENGHVPPGEHLLLAAPAWDSNVRQATSGRRVSWLGHYAPGNLDYYWVAGLGK
jgi:4-amino-4-deoxy-L-arabinose transferase-like glycosyltransferase